MKTAPKLPPEVTADIVRRLRQAEPDRRRRAAFEGAPVGETVYELDREDVRAAINDGILEVDHGATFRMNDGFGYTVRGLPNDLLEQP